MKYGLTSIISFLIHSFQGIPSQHTHTYIHINTLKNYWQKDIYRKGSISNLAFACLPSWSSVGWKVGSGGTGRVWILPACRLPRHENIKWPLAWLGRQASGQDPSMYDSEAVEKWPFHSKAQRGMHSLMPVKAGGTCLAAAPLKRHHLSSLSHCTIPIYEWYEEKRHPISTCHYARRAAEDISLPAFLCMPCCMLAPTHPKEEIFELPDMHAHEALLVRWWVPFLKWSHGEVFPTPLLFYPRHFSMCMCVYVNDDNVRLKLSLKAAFLLFLSKFFSQEWRPESSGKAKTSHCISHRKICSMFETSFSKTPKHETGQVGGCATLPYSPPCLPGLLRKKNLTPLHAGTLGRQVGG